MAACRRSTSAGSAPAGAMESADSRIPRASITCVSPRAMPGLIVLPVSIIVPSSKVDVSAGGGVDHADVSQDVAGDDEDDEHRDNQPHQPAEHHRQGRQTPPRLFFELGTEALERLGNGA